MDEELDMSEEEEIIRYLKIQIRMQNRTIGFLMERFIKYTGKTLPYPPSWNPPEHIQELMKKYDT